MGTGFDTPSEMLGKNASTASDSVANLLYLSARQQLRCQRFSLMRCMGLTATSTETSRTVRSTVNPQRHSCKASITPMAARQMLRSHTSPSRPILLPIFKILQQYSNLLSNSSTGQTGNGIASGLVLPADTSPSAFAVNNAQPIGYIEPAAYQSAIYDPIPEQLTEHRVGRHHQYQQ